MLFHSVSPIRSTIATPIDATSCRIEQCLMRAVAARRWPRAIDNGVVLPVLVSPGLARTAPMRRVPGLQRAVKVVCGNGTNWLLFQAGLVPKLWRVEHVLTINIEEEAS